MLLALAIWFLLLGQPQKFFIMNQAIYVEKCDSSFASIAFWETGLAQSTNEIENSGSEHWDQRRKNLQGLLGISTKHCLGVKFYV